jgi:hypothetical protein
MLATADQSWSCFSKKIQKQLLFWLLGFALNRKTGIFSIIQDII